MSRSSIDRLQDIIHSIDLVVRYVSDLGASDLAAGAGPRDAVLFRLVVICEAASRLPAELRALASEIPWAEIRDMRSQIVHGYWQIDFAIIINTIENDLEPLKTAAQRLIELVERNAS
jgi:uncharacterized protein with HEPN domain